jgi:hypothetical protein
MAAIAFGLALQHHPGEQRLPPQRDQTLRVEIARMEGPESHGGGLTLRAGHNCFGHRPGWRWNRSDRKEKDFGFYSNGVTSHSPGLRGFASYPGTKSVEESYPNGGYAVRLASRRKWHNPFRVEAVHEVHEAWPPRVARETSNPGLYDETPLG